MKDDTEFISTFQRKLGFLDAALTQKPWETILQTLRNSSIKKPEDFLFTGERTYYLSDGGYSRICYNILTDHLFLTSNSREEVKKAWDCCKELISDVEDEIFIGADQMSDDSLPPIN